MNNLENLGKTAENPSNEQNEWEEMAAEAPEFNQETTKEVVDLKEAANQLTSNNLNERFKGLSTYIESGNVKGNEGFIDSNFRSMAWKYRKITPPKEMVGYMRFVKMTETGKDPEKPLVEKPKTIDFINPSTDSKYRVREWRIDQEAIEAVKALSPEARESLECMIEYHKKEEERIRQAEENAPHRPEIKQPSQEKPKHEEEGPMSQEIAENPDPGLNVYHNLNGDWPFQGPFNTGF